MKSILSNKSPSIMSESGYWNVSNLLYCMTVRNCNVNEQIRKSLEAAEM